MNIRSIRILPERQASFASLAARTLFKYDGKPASVRLALIIVAVSLEMFIALIPFAYTPLATALWFIPLHRPVPVINDLVTTTLLLGYFRLTRECSILVLAWGSVFGHDGNCVPAVLSGIFTLTGLLCANA